MFYYRLIEGAIDTVKSVGTVPLARVRRAVDNKEQSSNMTFEWWPALVFGWPGPILAILLSVIGVVTGKRGWLVVAAFVLVLFALYLGANPRTRWLFLLPLVPSLGAIAIARRASLLAWLTVTDPVRSSDVGGTGCLLRRSPGDGPAHTMTDV